MSFQDHVTFVIRFGGPVDFWDIHIVKIGKPVDFLQGVLHLLPKISMFCALSQNNKQLLEKKLLKVLKNGIEILVSQAVF